MIRSAAVVVCLLVLGDALAEVLTIPIPGAAIGLFLLSLIFVFRGGPDEGFSALFDFAAPYFPLFFVPAAVGVVASLDALSSAFLHIAVAVVVSTALVLIVTGWLAQMLMPHRDADD